jgi:hypothetical protein
VQREAPVNPAARFAWYILHQSLGDGQDALLFRTLGTNLTANQEHVGMRSECGGDLFQFIARGNHVTKGKPAFGRFQVQQVRPLKRVHHFGADLPVIAVAGERTWLCLFRR